MKETRGTVFCMFFCALSTTFREYEKKKGSHVVVFLYPILTHFPPHVSSSLTHVFPYSSCTPSQTLSPRGQRQRSPCQRQHTTITTTSGYALISSPTLLVPLILLHYGTPRPDLDRSANRLLVTSLSLAVVSVIFAFSLHQQQQSSLLWRKKRKKRKMRMRPRM